MVRECCQREGVSRSQWVRLAICEYIDELRDSGARKEARGNRSKSPGGFESGSNRWSQTVPGGWEEAIERRRSAEGCNITQLLNRAIEKQIPEDLREKFQKNDSETR